MSSATGSEQDTAWDEADQLISILRTWGIGYLMGGDYVPTTQDIARDQASAVNLIQRLARCEYPRVRDAAIALFLLHPEVTPAILEAIHSSEPAVAEQIATLVLAALYLQRLWSIRLALALGHEPDLPEDSFAFLWESRHLPPPAAHHGKWGLLALQEAEQKRTGMPLTFTGDWQNQLNHLLLQEEAHGRHQAVPIKRLLKEEKQEYLVEDSKMSMRLDVDKTRIEDFLKNLGRTFHKPGRLYLVGGAALVHSGMRSGTTLDIDVELAGENEGEMIEAIRGLIRQMNINVEFASPRDFIPLPSQWEANAHFVGRYGSVDVFYFDFYSIALSKIERGNTRDIDDVKLLLQKNIITLEELDAAYREVLAQVGKGSYKKLDPERFAQRYEAVRRLLS